MSFKKFKHDLKKEKIEIPLMSDRLREYSEKERIYCQRNVKQKKSMFPIFRYASLLIPILVLLLTVTGVFIKDKDNLMSYQLYSVKNAEDFQRIVNYEKKIKGDIQESVDDFLESDKGDKGDKGDTEIPGVSNSTSSPEYNFSSTNTQEKNVDEADIVKTDGKNIYYLNCSKGYLYKYDIYTDEITKKVLYGSIYSNIKQPQIYVVDKYVILLQHYYSSKEANNERIVSIEIIDKQTFEVKKSYTGKGILIDSRVTNNTLYLIYNKVNVNELPKDKIDSIENTYEYSDIYYSPSLINQGYTFVLAMNLNNLELNVNIYLGPNSWKVVYMTENSLYLAYSTTSYIMEKYAINGSKYKSGRQTNILRLELNGINVDYTGLIITEGTVKNQFYMDEYNKHLRVVLEDINNGNITNKLEIYDLNKYESDNLYKKVAYIDEGIGLPGETIESVRFEDKSCLIVTYYRVINKDPLYYIDLSNQSNPKIIAGYEEPGYNSYLHYLNDDYAIGFGELGEVNIIKDKDSLSYVSQKVGLYEIKDGIPNKLDEKYFTFSAVLTNHKALYIEGSTFGFSHISSEESVSSDNLGIQHKGCYVIYSISYDGENPQLELIKLFSSQTNRYERMIRIDSNYYLISNECFEVLDSNFNSIKKIEIK